MPPFAKQVQERRRGKKNYNSTKWKLSQTTSARGVSCEDEPAPAHDIMLCFGFRRDEEEEVDEEEEEEEAWAMWRRTDRGVEAHSRFHRCSLLVAVTHR